MLDWDAFGRECFQHLETGHARGQATFVKWTRPVATDQNEPRLQNTQRILVLAVDDARWLLETCALDHTGWFQRFRRALNLTNAAIEAMYGARTGIFALLINSNAQFVAFNPPPSTKDPSSRELSVGKTVLFPPFILTQTMDVMLDASIKAQLRQEDQKVDGAVRIIGSSGSEAFYRAMVHVGTQEQMREVLVDMGRPLWQMYKIAKREQPPEDGFEVEPWLHLRRLASKKLTGPDKRKDPSAASGGVAALLCRLGLRPHSWSPLASQLVADHMAVLSYVNESQNQVVCSYSSDPILTFGAARLWYDVSWTTGLPVLDHQMLPELRKLLHQEMLDTGGSIGIKVVVAKMLLLLAMDATGVVATWNEAGRAYDGAFYSVTTFLSTLSGDSKVVVDEKGAESGLSSAPAVDELLQPWEEWRVGFNHFVEFECEPTADVLWAMLARRAVCALQSSRCHGVALLMVPIFKPEPTNPSKAHVSLILIQVESASSDGVKTAACVADMRLGVVLQGGLKDTIADKNVVRVSMDLGGHEPLEQYFLVDAGRERCSGQPAGTGEQSTTTTTTAPKNPFLLCIRGLDAWSVGQPVHVVCPGVASQLKGLLTPHHKLRAIAEADLAARDASVAVGMDPGEVVGIAVRPLVESLLVDTWQRIATPPAVAVATGDQQGDSPSPSKVRSLSEMSDVTDESENHPNKSVKSAKLSGP